MEQKVLSPEVQGLLEQVRVAVVEDRLSEAEEFMIKAMGLINSAN